MEDVYPGFLTKILSCTLSISSTGEQVIPDTWKKKPGHNQHCFISLFFLALNIFSVIQFLKYNLKLLLYQQLCQLFQEAGQHTHSFPAAHWNLLSTFPVPLHSTEILQFTQGQWVPTHLLHLWCHNERLFQHYTTSPTSLVTLSFNNCIWIDLNCGDAGFYYLHNKKALQDNSETPYLLRC